MINTNTDEDEKYLRLKDIGKKIVKRRKELNMTATELAIQADITASSLSLYETGQREMRIDTFYKISAVLKVPFSYFQAKELDEFLSYPQEFYPLMNQLKELPLEKQKMMLKMFSAQLNTL